MGLDSMGRLLTSSDGGVQRTAAGRYLGWLDLPERLDVSTEVTLRPSTAAGVESAQLHIGSTELSLEPGETWTLELSPSELETGLHELQAVIRWSDGTEARQSTELEVPQGGRVTWDADIEPLFQDHCQACHGGTSETILTEPDAWEERIEDIVALVEGGTMPLGEEALSAAQVDRIRAWWAGGFQ